jgi:hypothetical protein
LSIERPVADVLGIRCVPSGQIVHSSTRP